MSWWNEEKTYVNVSSAACIDWWDVSSGLLGAVMQPILNEGVEWMDGIQDAALNSPYCTWHHLAKKNTKSEKLGKVIGTDLTNGLSKNFIESYIRLKVSNISSVESFGINAFLPLANVYNELVDNYSFDYTSGRHTTLDATGLHPVIKEYIGTIQYQNQTLYVSTVGYDNRTNKQCYIYAYKVEEHEGTRMASNSGSASYPIPYTYTTFTEVKIPLALEWTQDEFLYISYYDHDGVRRVYAENIVNASDILKNEYKTKRDIQFPTLVARKDAKPVSTSDPELYEETLRASRRLRLEWEDMVAQLNGDLSSLNEPTEKDRKYSESIDDKCKSIYTTLAVDITANSPYVKEYLYRLFRAVYFKNSGFVLTPNTDGGELTYSCQDYHHYIKYGKITYQKHTGKICNVSRYAAKSGKQTEIKEISTGNSSIKIQITKTYLFLYHQTTKDTYYEITVENPVHYTDAFDQDKETSLPEFDNTKHFTKAEIKKILAEREGEDDDSEEDDPLGDPTEFVVPLYPVIVRQMGCMRGGALIQIAQRNVWETKQKVKKKWWQSTAFMIIRYIIYIIIITINTIYSGGTATAPTFEALSAIEVLFQVLISLAIKIAVKIICKIFKIDANTESFINAIIDTARMMYAVSLDNSAVEAASKTGESVAGAGLGGSSMALATSIGNSLGSMIINKNFTFQGFCDMLGGIATQGLASIGNQAFSGAMSAATAIAANASMVTVFTLATSPRFYNALNQRNFLAAIMEGMMAIASSFYLADSYYTRLSLAGTSASKSTANLNPTKAMLEEFKNGTSNALNSFSVGKMQDLQARIDEYGEESKKLSHQNANLEKVNRLMTAHNNQAVLRMLVNQSYYENLNELARLQSFA